MVQELPSPPTATAGTGSDSGVDRGASSESGEQSGESRREEELAPAAEENGTDHQAATAMPPLSPTRTTVLNSVVGYARSRLFRTANDAMQPIGAATLSPLRRHPIALHPSSSVASSSQSARGTPTRRGVDQVLKSCPVARRQWSASAAESNGENTSLGSRDSVATTTETTAGDSTSRHSWRELGSAAGGTRETKKEREKEHWQLFAITLQRSNQGGFGIAISGGPNAAPECSAAIVVSDVIPSGPAFGLLQVGDRIISVNGYPLEHADYSSAVTVMKDAQQLNMIVKRRVPVPFVEFEQRTLKFTLSKSRKKDDFGIVLGCRFFIKEILNPKLAEKEPGLKEGDTVLRVNGQSLEGITLDEATRLLQRSREKLSLVVQRDVRRGSSAGGGAGGSRWPSQTTVYERLGSVQATPRQSPTPLHYSMGEGQFPVQQQQQTPAFGRKYSAGPDYGGFKRFSDPMTGSVRADYAPQQQQQSMLMMNNNGRPMQAPPATVMGPNALAQTAANSGVLAQQHSSTSPFLHQQPQRLALQPTPPVRNQSQTPSSVHSLNMTQNNNNTGEQFNGVEHQQRMFAPLQSAQFQQRLPAREIHTVAFQKGPAGLGIRVIGGNQAGIFVSAVQEHSPADQHGIRVGDRIHAVNGTSMVGVTREEAFDFLLSLAEQQIQMAVEHSIPEEYAQVKAGKCGDSFYVRTHFAHKPDGNGPSGRQRPQQIGGVPPELGFLSGDIFHVTDTLYGGSPGFWQVTKVYSAADVEPKAGLLEPGMGIIPHAKVAEVLMRRQRQAERACAEGMQAGAGSGEGTLGRTLFRKKLSLSSRKLFGGGSGNGSASAADQSAEDVLSAGSGNYSAELCPPAYERVALKRPAFHRPVVLYGPLADIARQHLLSKFALRFGAPLPSTPSVGNNGEPLMSASTSSATDSLRGIPLAAVDAVMAAQKHCVLCVSPGSVERLQLAQYAPIVVLIDVESRSRVRELRSKAGASAGSARKLMEHAQRVKKQHQHLLTATLDASKEDQWFDALRQLIFHLQERRVWMPEFQPSYGLDDLLLFPLQLPGETPTSDSGDYGVYEQGCNGNGGTAAAEQQRSGTLPSGQSPGVAVVQQQRQRGQQVDVGGGGYFLPNPVYSLVKSAQPQQPPLQSEYDHPRQQQQMGFSCARPPAQQDPSAPHSARNSPFAPSQQQHLSLYTPMSARPEAGKGHQQMLLANELIGARTAGTAQR